MTVATPSTRSHRVSSGCGSSSSAPRSSSRAGSSCSPSRPRAPSPSPSAVRRAGPLAAAGPGVTGPTSSRTRSSALCALAIAVGVALAPVAAAAQDDSDATRARAAFDLGTRRFQARRYEEALTAFMEAYEIRPHPAVLFNIASCYDKLDRTVDAYNTYQTYLSDRQDEIEPARRRDINRALTRLRPRVALVRIAPPERGVDVTLDGETLAPAAEAVAVEPGAHVVASVARDGREARAEFTAVAGETSEVALSWPDEAGNTNDGESGREVGGGGSGAAGGDGHTDGPTPRDGSGWSPALRWIGLGATVVFAAGWAYTGVRALSIHGDYEDEQDQEKKKQLRDDGLTYRAFADFLFLPGTILCAGFTVLAFVLARSSDDEPAAAASIGAAALPLPGGGALVLSGAF